MRHSRIEIVPFEERDFGRVHKLLAEAFQGKFRSLVTLDDNGIADMLAEVWLEAWKGGSGKQMVAQCDGEFAGTLCLKWSCFPSQSSPPIDFLRLFKQYGYRNTLKFLAGLHFLEYKPDFRECYIDHLAVCAKYRGQGIGKLLLLWAQNEVSLHAEFDKLSLHVANTNPGAIRLYKQLAFHLEKSGYSAASHFLFNEPKWHYMTWKANDSSLKENV
jgi:ribosomal protein S18 acetylase RimI-like enzyme